MAGRTPRDTADTIDKYFADSSYRAEVQRNTKELRTTYSFERMSAELIAAYSLALGT